MAEGMDGITQSMFLDPSSNTTPSFIPTPERSPDPIGDLAPDESKTPITITLGMWETLLNRLAAQGTTIDELTHDLQTLRQRHATLERDHYTFATSSPKPYALEPKIPDPPMFNGDRKELLPFLTKCQLKFEGQPSRFQNERSKVLYAGTRLEGAAFNWFQPYIKLWPADTPSELAPTDIRDWKSFQRSLTRVYGDPNLAATAERELRRLRQTTSVADYAAKFESHKQYLSWNDMAFRDQFYLNLKDDVKDEIAPLGKPETLHDLKELAIRLDSRLEERRREYRPTVAHSPAISRPPNPRPTATIATTPAVTTPASTTATNPPTPALRTPSHTTDGTVPMELDATGVWRLAASERERRRQHGLCGYCAGKGHITPNCPVRPSGLPRQPRLERRALMSFELTSDDSRAEKATTQE